MFYVEVLEVVFDDLNSMIQFTRFGLLEHIYLFQVDRFSLIHGPITSPQKSVKMFAFKTHN